MAAGATDTTRAADVTTNTVNHFESECKIRNSTGLQLLDTEDKQDSNTGKEQVD